MSSNGSHQTIIIGGGQAGLAAGYFLSTRGVDFIILDENPRTGEAWRQRWDSLRLFTPTQNSNLPGMKFPGAKFYFPTKDEAAGYVESYARQFNLPVQNGTKVVELARNESGYRVSTQEAVLHARNVVVATGPFQTPFIPRFGRELDHKIFQLHSVNYHHPADVPGDKVVVVGAGNSGAEIALELARDGRQVWLAGRDVGIIPADRLGKILGGRPYWWFLHKVMTNATPIGRRMKANVLEHGNPLIRTRREEVAEAGVKFIPRLAGTQAGMPQTEDGEVLAAEGVVWATGFKPDYHWIKLPIFDETGRPRHARGVVPEAPGLYFLGLHFQTGLTSSLMGGVGMTRSILWGRLSIKCLEAQAARHSGYSPDHRRV